MIHHRRVALYTNLRHQPPLPNAGDSLTKPRMKAALHGSILHSGEGEQQGKTPQSIVLRCDATLRRWSRRNRAAPSLFFSHTKQTRSRYMQKHTKRDAQILTDHALVNPGSASPRMGWTGGQFSGNRQANSELVVLNSA